MKVTTTRSRALTLAFLAATFLCGCLNDDFATTGQAVTTVYSLGNPQTLATTFWQPVKYMYKTTGLTPYKPVGAESAGSSFSDKWTVDNGGTCIPFNGQTRGSGSLNRITFWVYRVNNGGNDYYVAQVDVIFTDGFGNCTIQQQIAVVTGWPRDQFLMTYSNDQFHLVVENQVGAVTWDLAPVPFTFTAGTVMPTRVYSPTVQVGMDTSQQYGGCMRDVPNYDDSSNDTVHYKVDDNFGGNSPSFPVYLSSPTSNAHCSMGVDHSDALGYDTVHLHVDGF